MAISVLKIRRPLGRLIFNMGIAIPGKTVFLIETAPWWFQVADRFCVWSLLLGEVCSQRTINTKRGLMKFYHPAIRLIGNIFFQSTRNNHYRNFIDYNFLFTQCPTCKPARLQPYMTHKRFSHSYCICVSLIYQPGWILAVIMVIMLSVWL